MINFFQNHFKLIILACFFFSCSRIETTEISTPSDENGLEISDDISLELLPEELIVKDEVSGLEAFYAKPTTRYPHGILGDRIEAAALVLKYQNKRYVFDLSESDVFEDLVPRLSDVDNDGFPEIICIRSNNNLGASVAVFKFTDQKKINLIASSPFIGTANRWLNIAAIQDLDNDGIVEIAWIRTPHIGGILQVGRIMDNDLMILDQMTAGSNHKIGSRNLCLSVVVNNNGKKDILLPSQNYSEVVSFSFVNEKIVKNEEVIEKEIDVNQPLIDQIQLNAVVLKDGSCGQ